MRAFDDDGLLVWTAHCNEPRHGNHLSCASWEWKSSVVYTEADFAVGYVGSRELVM